MEQFPEQNNAASEKTPMKAARTSNVWVVSLPFFSHFLCASQLAALIAKHGLTVTLFGAKNDIQRLQTSRNQIVENWNDQGLDLHLRPLEIQSPKIATFMEGTARMVDPFTQAANAFEEILKNELDKKLKPTCVISDSFFPGALEVAEQFEIPAWPFVTVSPGLTAANIYIHQLQSKGILTLPDSFLDRKAQQELINLPGLPLMRICDVPDVNFKSDPLYVWGCRRVELLRKAENIILNSVRDLEPRACYELEMLLKTYASVNSKKVPHIWTTGPLFPLNSYSPYSKGGKSEDEDVNRCIKFLDSQSPSSVVYVAFGTDVRLSCEQIQELVHGLESSHQPFLCVLHPPKKLSNSDLKAQDILSLIPSDCLERIGSRGLFVTWAPQQEVLCHQSTGAFISHCGYSSLLESVCMGVPILAWPWQYDQFANCRILADEVQTAVEVCPGLLPGGYVDRKDVEKSINTLFHSDDGTAVRNRALHMKHRAEESVRENGSSTKNMQALVALMEGMAKLNVEESSPQML